jgi:hypothetical protein
MVIRGQIDRLIRLFGWSVGSFPPPKFLPGMQAVDEPAGHGAFNDKRHLANIADNASHPLDELFAAAFILGIPELD